MSTSTRQMWERVLHESQTSLMREADAPTMTDAQMRRREKYVKALKKKSADLKSRYGNRWKQVMYATATKMAMQEAASTPTSKSKLKEDVSLVGASLSSVLNFIGHILTQPVPYESVPVVFMGLLVASRAMSLITAIASTKFSRFVENVKKAYALYTTEKTLTPQQIAALTKEAKEVYASFGPATKATVTRLSNKLSKVDLQSATGKKAATEMFIDLSKIVRRGKNVSEWQVAIGKTLTEAETEPELTADQKKRRDEILKGLKQNAEAFKANYGDEWEAVLDATATSMALEQPEEFEATLTEEVAEDITADEVAKGLKELDKPTEKLTAAQINRELDTLETYGFVVTMRLGIARFTQAMSEMKRLLDLQRKIDKRKSALVHEIGLRYAPMGVHHRLPDEKQYNARPVTEGADVFGSPDDTDPLRMKAASTFAREFVDGPIVGQSPEEIVNNAIKAWFTQTPNSFTPDRMQAFGQGLDLLNKMHVAWDLSLIPTQFLPDL